MVKGGEGKGRHSFTVCIQTPEDVKREKEVRKNATRNPLKLQELIEQEAREAGRRTKAAVRRVSRFNLLNPRWQSVGRSVGWVHGSGADLSRLVGRSEAVPPKGGLRGGKRENDGRTTWMELEKQGFHLWNSGGISFNGGRGGHCNWQSQSGLERVE